MQAFTYWHETYLIFCTDEWLVNHESLKRFAHETWEEVEFLAAKRLPFALVTIWQLELQANFKNHLHISRSKF